VLSRGHTAPYAAVLAALAALFLFRVVGQALVAFASVPFLPSMAHWYSGLLPYPLLLPAQLLILAAQAVVCVQFARGRGPLVTPRRRGLGHTLLVLAALYAGAMVVRYALTMAWYPERRWLGPGTIPSIFHVVLAAFIGTVGRYHATSPKL
jgi:hypothetical protein